MRDRSHPLELLRQAAARRDQAGIRRHLVPRGADHDGLVDLASNDYLGLGGDQRLAAGAVRAAQEWGTGATGSRLVTGTTALHTRLEARLAEFAAEEGLRVSTPDAAVLAVTVGESAVAVRSQKACAAYGVRVGCFRPPSVPRGQACLRLAGRASLIVPGTRRSRLRRDTRRSRSRPFKVRLDILLAPKDEDSSRDIGVARLALAGNWTILRSTDIPEEVGGVSILARKSRVSTPRIR
jgi:hypothetical protein